VRQLDQLRRRSDDLHWNFHRPGESGRDQRGAGTSDERLGLAQRRQVIEVGAEVLLDEVLAAKAEPMGQAMGRHRSRPVPLREQRALLEQGCCGGGGGCCG
jgi:hypothetical protein